MNNEYLVVAKGVIICDSSQYRAAVEMAEAFAASNVGEQAVLYKNEAVFTARVVVDNNYPTMKAEADHG